MSNLLQLGHEFGQTNFPFEKIDSLEQQIASVEKKLDLGVTFKDSLKQGAFGWYPYVEGFSANYITEILERFQPRNVYDPFGGSGTTCLAASRFGITSYYSEVNPFMAFVTETKVNGSIWAKSHQETFNELCQDFIGRLCSKDFDKMAKNVDLSSYQRAFPNRDFFELKDIQELLCARNIALEYGQAYPYVKDLLVLACASNTVKSSNMTRRADLRRRRPDEYKNRIVNVTGFIVDSVQRMCDDVVMMPGELVSTVKVSENAMSISADFEGEFDFALTSPPYLNGTNYFRNTKIELWLAGFISGEKDLGAFNRQAITAGINNVTKNKPEDLKFATVELVVEKLLVAATDSRIPRLVRHYFSDMHQMFLQVLKGLKPGAKFVLDIGDSKFYGVHVQTDRLLIDVAVAAGFNVDSEKVIARRHSRDKSELKQVEIVFSKPLLPVGK
jgi:hypothetical protein